MSYYDKARRRARRRRSPWNLLLVPAVIGPCGLLWWELAKLFEAVHGAIYAGQNLTVTPRGVGAVLTAVAPFFAAIPTAMFIGNILVWLVPPARRALDAEAKPNPGTDFRASQYQMLLLVRYLVVPALGVALLGALLPWSA